MAHVNRRLGNLDAAREGYARAHELRADDVPTMVWLAEIELEGGHMDEALEWARSALAVDPHCAHAMLIEGRVALARRGS